MWLECSAHGASYILNVVKSCKFLLELGSVYIESSHIFHSSYLKIKCQISFLFATTRGHNGISSNNVDFQICIFQKNLKEFGRDKLEFVLEEEGDLCESTFDCQFLWIFISERLLDNLEELLSNVFNVLYICFSFGSGWLLTCIV
jgi:hypothetical protein